MFLLYVLGVFAISLFGSQCQPQTRELLFQCYSWGDPHVQTWHAKNGAQIQNRDCFVNGHHTLVNNPILLVKVHVKHKLVTEIIVKFHDEKGHLLLHIDFNISYTATVNDNLRQQGITFTISGTGSQITYTLSYAKENVLLVITQVATYFNIQTTMPQALIDQSNGMCALRDTACTQRGVETDELEWQPVRSGSTKQLFTNEQAENICNEHINAYFTKIHPAPYQRDAHVNSLVANVLAGCIADVVLTGEIEVAQAGIDVLMINELTKDATTVEDMQAAIQAGVEEASVLVRDAVKMANARVRRFI